MCLTQGDSTHFIRFISYSLYSIVFLINRIIIIYSENKFSIILYCDSCEAAHTFYLKPHAILLNTHKCHVVAALSACSGCMKN